MSLSDNVPMQNLIHFFYNMNAEDFELAVAAIILLQRVRERKFKRKPRKQCVRAKFKERKEEGGKRKNFHNT